MRFHDAKTLRNSRTNSWLHVFGADFAEAMHGYNCGGYDINEPSKIVKAVHRFLLRHFEVQNSRALDCVRNWVPQA